MIQVIVCGVEGRMGGRLVQLVLESEDLELVGGTEQSGHPLIGKMIAPGVVVKEFLSDVIDRPNGEVDVVLDFTAPFATLMNSRTAGNAGIPMVIGTTGFDSVELALLHEHVASIPCVIAPNYAVGVNLLFKLVEEVARILGDEYDVEIVEAHHRFKKDAPSGTALKLAQAAARGLDRNLEEVAVYGRHGAVGERPKKEIGIHALRLKT